MRHMRAPQPDGLIWSQVPEYAFPAGRRMGAVLAEECHPGEGWMRVTTGPDGWRYCPKHALRFYKI